MVYIPPKIGSGIFLWLSMSIIETIEQAEASDEITTAGAVLDALGGNTKVANHLGEQHSTVSMWRLRGRFPSRVFFRMQAMLIERGLKAPPSLWGVE
jgi:hypothetical protein